MKKLFLSVVVTLFLGTAFANANYPNPTEKFSETHKELSKIFESFPSLDSLNEDVLVRVKIILNEKREIVVLNTSTTNEDVNYFIKSILNYKKMTSDELAIGEDYVFAVRFKK